VTIAYATSKTSGKVCMEEGRKGRKKEKEKENERVLFYFRRRNQEDFQPRIGVMAPPPVVSML